MAFWSIHNRGPRDLQSPQSSWMNKFMRSPEALQPFMDMLSPHSFLTAHSYRAALWAPCTLVEDERKRHAENRVNIQCGQVALTLLQLPSSLRAFRSARAGKSFIRVFCLSPSWDLFLSYTTMIGGLTADVHLWEVTRTLQKSQSIWQKLWTDTAPGNHLYLLMTDFCFLTWTCNTFNTTLTAVCLERPLPADHGVYVLCLMDDAWRATMKPSLEAWELCVRISPHSHGCGLVESTRNCFPPRTQLC